MSLAPIIIMAGSKEIAGFTVGGYLAEKAADIGTGKIWAELKRKIGNKPDTFESRLYNAIERSDILLQYSGYAKQDDILEWYRSFQDQIIKDDILHPMFMMNNMQLNGELQKERDKKIDHSSYPKPLCFCVGSAESARQKRQNLF